MAEKTDNFVTGALVDLAAIKNQMEQLSAQAQELTNRWAALNKTNMSGYDTYNWSVYPFTQAEFTAAMNSLINDLAGTTLNNINTTGPIDKIVKLGLR